MKINIDDQYLDLFMYVDVLYWKIKFLQTLIFILITFLEKFLDYHILWLAGLMKILEKQLGQSCFEGPNEKIFKTRFYPT